MTGADSSPIRLQNIKLHPVLLFFSGFFFASTAHIEEKQEIELHWPNKFIVTLSASAHDVENMVKFDTL